MLAEQQQYRNILKLKEQKKTQKPSQQPGNTKWFYISRVHGEVQVNLGV